MTTQYNYHHYIDIANNYTTVSPGSTGKPNYAHGSKNTDIAIEVGVPLAVIAILIAVVIITCITYRKLVQLMHIVIYIQLPIHYLCICSCINIHLHLCASFLYLLAYRFRNPDYDRIDHDVDQLNDSQNPAFGKL